MNTIEKVLVGVGTLTVAALGTIGVVNKACSNASDKIAKGITPNIEQKIIDDAVKKAVNEATAKAVYDATKDIKKSVYDNAYGKVKADVDASVNGIAQSVKDKARNYAKGIDMSALQRTAENEIKRSMHNAIVKQVEARVDEYMDAFDNEGTGSTVIIRR